MTLPRWWRAFDEDAPVTVAPRRHAVHTPPYDAQQVAFRLPEEAAAAGAVLKVSANGKTVYEALP